MKISVAWLFDYLGVDWKKQDIAHLYKVFNQKTAEMEKVEKVFFDTKSFAFAIVQKVSATEIFVSIPELKKETTLPFRSDALVQSCFMVQITPQIVWAAPHHLDSDKEGLLPHFSIPTTDLAGNWKKNVETKDVILEIDNKSLTHRPDLWGHFGFAREVAAILDLEFKPLKNNLAITTTTQNPFKLENQAPQDCKRFMATYFESFKENGSNLFIALRLLRVGMRAINGIVDLTNYVMLETSQPVHAFDAQKIADKKLIIRKAKTGEKLTLLDGQELVLTQDDLVIADPVKVLALAGVRGGLHDSITPNTTSIFFEVANFDATTIRRGAARHKTRTDASARFEKTLDPNQLELTTSRFVELAQQFDIKFTMVGAPLIIGAQDTPKTITVAHEFLVSRSGIALTKDEVIKPLQKLGFEVTHQAKENAYCITIPTFRGTKDVQCSEDILEEVVRMYGFEKIIPVLPCLTKQPENLTPLLRLRKVKNYLSLAANMLEQQNYAFFDEDFMAQLTWKMPELIELAHPVSEQYKRLCTSLIPNLLKNVQENAVEFESLAFFEAARIWNKLSDKEHGERKRIAGIVFEKKAAVDFYTQKAMLSGLFLSCDVQEVIWKKVDTTTTLNHPWMRPFQVAELFVGTTSIGYAGKLNPLLMTQLQMLPESDAFVFELDAEFLYNYQAPLAKFEPLARYQGSSFDISCLIPLRVTAAELEATLKSCNSLIKRVALIDFFEKEEWTDQRSLALRVWIAHPEKTMTKEEIEAVYATAIAAVTKKGATIRA